MQTLFRTYSELYVPDILENENLPQGHGNHSHFWSADTDEWLNMLNDSEKNLQSILGCSCPLLKTFCCFFGGRAGGGIRSFVRSFFLFFISFFLAPYAIFLFPASWQQGAALLSPSQSCLQMWEAIRFCSTTGRVD